LTFFPCQIKSPNLDGQSHTSPIIIIEFFYIFKFPAEKKSFGKFSEAKKFVRSKEMKENLVLLPSSHQPGELKNSPSISEKNCQKKVRQIENRIRTKISFSK